MFEVDREDGVAVLRMDHGKVNAFDVELAEGLTGAIRQLADDPVRAVVFTGAGRAFSAGVDLYQIIEGGREYSDGFLPALSELCNAFFEFPKPLVTTVNGAAVAGGCVLACCGDQRLIAHGARIGAPEVRVGVPFPVSPLEILRFACGRHTEQVIYSGRLYEGQEAVGVGIAHQAVAADDLLERAMTAAADLASLAPDTFQMTKAQIRRPTIERIAADASKNDAAAQALWGAEGTAATIRGYLDRTIGRG